MCKLEQLDKVEELINGVTNDYEQKRINFESFYNRVIGIITLAVQLDILTIRGYTSIKSALDNLKNEIRGV